MKLRSLNRIISLLILLTFSFSVLSEDQIDIWNKEKIKKKETIKTTNEDSIKKNSTIFNIDRENNNFKIEGEELNTEEEVEIFGIYDPAENGFSLNMWSKTNAEDVRSSIKRLNKIKLSRTSNQIFEKTLFSFSYPPQGMNEKEFIDLKIDWMIKNKRVDLIEKFLNQNNEFHNKKKIVQYLVDENISKANIKKSCEKISFIDKNIKDPYLEKFKIYCLVFNNKKNEAQLLYDILVEQKQSDKYFDDKINFLLGISDKTTSKINEENLLNFYLSSITNKNFEYEPNKKTKKIIWEYLNAANLIKFEDIENKEKIKDLELAANQGQFDFNKIFDIYKKIPFELNSLINANDIYQTLDGIDSRALLYQKFLLSDDNQNKVKLLFLLEDLFKKDDLINVYSQFLINRLKEIDQDEIPEAYQKIVSQKIKKDSELSFGKIKYDDKILHRSKVIKFFTENADKKKVQKDFDKIYRKIKKNKKYFYSAKDLALINSLEKDNFVIPKDLNYLDLSKKYDIPDNLLELANKDQPAFLTLKIIEIIGEDEPYQLDPETIYFITFLLNQIDLKKIRNEVLISALPFRS
tara:strand:+ start:9999 stop:11732 length:1734 start_codon:yes stop_codon:yes gene_type:complete